MTAQGWLQIVVFVAVLFALAPLLGNYMAKVYTDGSFLLGRVLGPVERFTYRVLRVRWARAKSRKYCELGTDSEHLLERAMAKQGLSARAHDRILKVARTVADLRRRRDHRTWPHCGGHPVSNAGSHVLGIRNWAGTPPNLPHPNLESSTTLVPLTLN